MGVSLAGFEPIQVVEWDSYCCDTIRENRERGIAPMASWPLTQADVRAVDFGSNEGKVELVTGGPPCQPFSIGGRHRAFNDARDMFPQAVRALREVKPKAFIFENVKGLTRQTFRNYFEYIRLQMIHPEVTARHDESWAGHHARLEQHESSGGRSGLSYNVIVHLANAADYGVPQRRERVFFVGFRSDLGIAWRFPAETHSADALAWAQYRDGEYWDRHRAGWRERATSERARVRAWRLRERPATVPWRTVRDAIADLPDPEIGSAPHRYLNHRFQPGARSYAGHTGSPFDEPAKTLKAGVHGVPGGENMLLKPDGSVRYFTVRESARLQTFPDEFRFHGSWTESMRQLGNAVPVTLARIVANDVMRHLENMLDDRTLQSAGQTKPRAKH
ncbi:MAG: DNA cytosine methyltransferase [Devosia sp.]|nr:DNA cytosine methyltransferase [Devosia sp.]